VNDAAGESAIAGDGTEGRECAGRIVVGRNDAGRAQQAAGRFYRVELTTGQRTFWKSVEPADAAGIDAIGRVMMSADNKAYVYSYVRTLSDLYLVERG
jgi:hypothetical protein